MKIEGLHEKEIFSQSVPFRTFVNQNLNFDYPPHWHNAVELIYIVENPFTVYVNTKEYVLQEKEILFIPAGDIHEFHSESRTGTRIFINFELSATAFYSSLDGIRMRLCDVRKITPQEGFLYGQIQDQIVKMWEHPQVQDTVNTMFHMARMLDILVLLCRSAPSYLQMETLGEDKRKLVGLDKIHKSFEYIERYYAEEIHLKDIAQAAGFSEYYFSRLFKEITGKNFHQYLNEFRIKKAEQFLTDPQYTVSCAAYSAGFNSIATFGRVFRKIKGCSPQEFRKLKVPLQ